MHKVFGRQVGGRKKILFGLKQVIMKKSESLSVEFTMFSMNLALSK